MADEKNEERTGPRRGGSRTIGEKPKTKERPKARRRAKPEDEQEQEGGDE